MKIFNTIKLVGLAAIVMSVAVGCASTQNENTAAKGPSDGESAIAAAAAACKKAASVGGVWRDTGKFIKKAKAALKEGDEATAIKLANKTRQQCELGYEQALREKELFDQKYGAHGNTYTVEKGDSLWKISGKDAVYGNPYQWPLLYKTNRASIKDADLIFPGQDLSIDRAASSAEIDAAVRHAKTRGAWSVGPVEARDTDYLGK